MRPGVAVGLIFTDIPTAVSVTLYDEAARCYADKVKRRARAVYTVGQVMYPGLSDLDILVVVEEAHNDNGQFFSVYDRLPQRYQKLFLHQPFILPATTLDTICHTSHARATLIGGDDVLKSLKPSAGLEERWCKLLESYCNFHAYVQHNAGRNAIPAKMTIAVASSMRHELSDFDTIQGTSHTGQYASAIDALRAKVLDDPAAADGAVSAIWDLLNDKVRWLTGALSDILPLETDESLLEFSHQFLGGNRAFASLRLEDITARKRTIDGYHGELHRMKFPYGYLFFLAAYGASIPRYFQPVVSKAWFKAYYRALRLSAGSS